MRDVFLVKREGRPTWEILSVAEVAGNEAFAGAEVDGPYCFADARPEQLRRNAQVRERLSRQRRRREISQQGTDGSTWFQAKNRVF